MWNGNDDRRQSYRLPTIILTITVRLPSMLLTPTMPSALVVQL